MIGRYIIITDDADCITAAAELSRDMTGAATAEAMNRLPAVPLISDVSV